MPLTSGWLGCYHSYPSLILPVIAIGPVRRHWQCILSKLRHWSFDREYRLAFVTVLLDWSNSQSYNQQEVHLCWWSLMITINYFTFPSLNTANNLFWSFLNLPKREVGTRVLQRHLWVLNEQSDSHPELNGDELFVCQWLPSIVAQLKIFIPDYMESLSFREFWNDTCNNLLNVR